MIKKIKLALKTFLVILKKPEMQILPGQIAFYFLMSIIPIAAISAILASYITSSFDFTDSILAVVPEVLVNILISLSDNMQLEGIAVVLILYLLLGSNAPASIIIASDMLYGVKAPRFLRLKIKSFVMTIMIVLLLLFVVFIPLLGDIIVSMLIQIFNSSNLYNYAWIYQIVKIVVSYLIIYTIIKLLYTIAPDAKIKSKTTTLGAIFTTISWIFITDIFAFYITDIASYDVIYGNFANVLILLLWLYILAYLFVVGMVINVNTFQKKGKCIYEKKGKKGKEENSKVINFKEGEKSKKECSSRSTKKKVE